MANYATELQETLRAISQLEKKASTNSGSVGSKLTETLAAGCSSLYGDFCKHAGVVIDYELPYPNVAHLTNYAMKLAMDLGITNNLDAAIKLGGAILVDQMLAAQNRLAITPAQHEKIAELQLFGREYIVSLLQGVFRV